ncbi:MAG: Lpg1974 family pore-forming outer membrane protein [Pirellulales bacterium]
MRFAYTRYGVDAAHAAAGDLTAAFLGGKQAQPPSPKIYFDTGAVATELDYDIFDLDLGKRFYPSPSLMIRPIVGLRGGRIDQSFETTLQATYAGTIGQIERTAVERMTNDFWGIGPKFGVETAVNLARGDEYEVNLTANFYAAYLIGRWTVDDVTGIVDVENGVRTVSEKTIAVPDRDFGATTFQTVIGVNWRYGGWSVAAGYELNDWLNQCQIFDDATGPHNNDLILQGLTLTAAFAF